MLHLGPVQTSCFCRAELNPGIRLDPITAEARRLNQTLGPVQACSKRHATAGPNSNEIVISI